MIRSGHATILDVAHDPKQHLYSKVTYFTTVILNATRTATHWLNNE